MYKLSFTLLVDALRCRPVGNNVAPVIFRSAPNEKNCSFEAGMKLLIASYCGAGIRCHVIVLSLQAAPLTVLQCWVATSSPSSGMGFEVKVASDSASCSGSVGHVGGISGGQIEAAI